MTPFALRPSRYLTTAFATAHSMAAGLVFPLQVPLPVKLLLWILVLASLAHALLRHALLRTPNAVVSGTVRDGTAARVTLRSSAELHTDILPTTYVTPFLTVLNLRIAGERLARHVLLVSDNIDHEDYRKLRVVLKWARDSERVRQSAGSDPQAVR